MLLLLSFGNSFLSRKSVFLFFDSGLFNFEDSYLFGFNICFVFVGLDTEEVSLIVFPLSKNLSY